MKRISFLLIVVSLISLLPLKAEAKFLLVDDFNDMARPNNLGGDYDFWQLNWEDPTQSCKELYDSSIKRGEEGYSMKLDYDVDSPNPAACGFWTLLENADLRQYDRLIFYVKGDEAKGYTTKFKVDLCNAKQISRCLVTGITSSWKRIEIPFSKFPEITEWSAMVKLSIIFEDQTVTAKVGTIYIDDIYFSDKTREASKLESRIAWLPTEDTATSVQREPNL